MNTKHGGRDLPGPIRADWSCFRTLSCTEIKNDRFQWKCPLCRFGVPLQEPPLASRYMLDVMRGQHRAAKHSGVSQAAFHAAAIAQMHKRTQCLTSRWAAIQNKTIAAAVKGGNAETFEGFTTLPMPVLRNRDGQLRLLIRKAYACDVCHHLYVKPSNRAENLLARKCCQPQHRSLKARIRVHKAKCKVFENAVRRLRRVKHGMPSDTFESIVVSFRAALGRSDPSLK